ncbi:hypothetical protein [Thiocystis violacea]|uniref:hypothetical protein n=1 Tax=Thiocystis violacea TaxID=13725 RepID=UPI0019071EFD|nr:hypothetical protein [Thiocystis violacea]MBK1719240.1 hypothetical protein [Thiocystis violacea]
MTDEVGYPVEIQNARAAVTWPRLAGGRLQVYSYPRPETNGGAITTQVLLAEFALPDPIGEIENGVFTADPVPSALILADDNAAWARGIGNLGETVCDFDAGLFGSGAAVQFDSLALVAGGYLNLLSFVVAEG